MKSPLVLKIYKLFKKNSIKLDYLVFEDVEQAEIRGAEVSKSNDMTIICLPRVRNLWK